MVSIKVRVISDGTTDYIEKLDKPETKEVMAFLIPRAQAERIPNWASASDEQIRALLTVVRDRRRKFTTIPEELTQ